MRKLHYPKFLIKILRLTFGFFLKKYYNINFIDKENVKKFNRPFILLANHCGFWDPFFICIYLEQEIHFVTSDNIFRNPIFNFFMNLFGSIPKSKFIPDIETIKLIFKVIKENKSVGIFPETNRTWDGSTFKINPNIGKLVKKLGIDLIGAKIKGGYLSLPRWAQKKRYGKVIIEYDFIVKSSDLQNLNEEKINQLVEEWFKYNEDDFIFKNNFKYKGKNLAQYIERVLFICPNCNSFVSIFSSKNHFFCKNCGVKFVYNETGIIDLFKENNSIDYYKKKFDKNDNNKELKNFKITDFNTVNKWNKWQINYLYSYLKNKLLNILDNFNLENFKSINNFLFIEKELAFVERGYRLKKAKFLTKGFLNISFFNFTIKDLENKTSNFPLFELEGINVQDKEILEFYHENNLYRIFFKNKRISVYKWLLYFLLIKKIIMENIEILDLIFKKLTNTNPLYQNLSNIELNNNMIIIKETIEKILNYKIKNKITKLNIENIFNF
ncbi:MAG: 1-acyl-sn-glycerol-3-phosphate acyltransferase [Spirochaetes bacterium]|nr:1-acyl-sn-glycerol-3-phosphate acyltransferase [Spirochaetota bacterium]